MVDVEFDSFKQDACMDLNVQTNFFTHFHKKQAFTIHKIHLLNEHKSLEGALYSLNL